LNTSGSGLEVLRSAAVVVKRSPATILTLENWDTSPSLCFVHPSSVNKTNQNESNDVDPTEDRQKRLNMMVGKIAIGAPQCWGIFVDAEVLSM